jgi:hypothetical protein
LAAAAKEAKNDSHSPPTGRLDKMMVQKCRRCCDDDDDDDDIICKRETQTTT